MEKGNVNIERPKRITLEQAERIVPFNLPFISESTRTRFEESKQEYERTLRAIQETEDEYNSTLEKVGEASERGLVWFNMQREGSEMFQRARTLAQDEYYKRARIKVGVKSARTPRKY